MLVQLFKLLSAEGARQLASGRKINTVLPLKKEAYVIQCRCKAVNRQFLVLCHRPPQKDPNDSYYTGAERASELNILSCYHRDDGKGVHIPVGDISKIEGREWSCRL